MSFNCKRLVCVLIALVMVICMTSVVAFAEGSEDVSQEESMTENSAVTENNGETIFEIIENGEGTIMERLAHGGKVTLVGMLVVFAVLIVLMIVLYVFQWIFGAKSKKTASVKESVPAPAPASAPVVAAPAANNNEEEVVAVATAAIAAARGESECAFNVISITQID